jgi:hypothetical protein
VMLVTAVKLQGFTHTWRGDLHIILKDPASVAYNVIVRPGSSGTTVGDSGNYLVGDYTFVDAGGGTVAQGATNINPGTYNVFQNTATGQWTLGINNVALSTITGPAGNWTLEIRDWAGLDVGALTGWTLEGTDNAATNGAAFCAGDNLDPNVTTDCPCSNFGGAGRGCASSFNAAGAGLTASGSTALDNVVLTADGVNTTGNAIFMRGDVSNVVGVVFGDGVRCVDGTLIRRTKPISSPNVATFPAPADTVTLSTGWGAANSTPPGSGITAHYMAYYRNAAAAFCPPETFNGTNGWIITW